MLDKAIQYGKEKRKPYYGAKAFSCSCRNHGTCSYCQSNRMYHTNKQLIKTDYLLQEYLNNAS